jgi:hypothetical protein
VPPKGTCYYVPKYLVGVVPQIYNVRAIITHLLLEYEIKRENLLFRLVQFGRMARVCHAVALSAKTTKAKLIALENVQLQVTQRTTF